MSYQFISKNKHVVQYVEDMAEWIEQNSPCTSREVFKLFVRNREKVQSIFNPYPETIFHDDPAKWAELFANTWGVIEEVELEFA
jgi:hypothetical protein